MGVATNVAVAFIVAMHRHRRPQAKGSVTSSEKELVCICSALGCLLLDYMEPLDSIRFCCAHISFTQLNKQRLRGAVLETGTSALGNILETLRPHTLRDCILHGPRACPIRITVINAILSDSLQFNIPRKVVVCELDSKGNSPALLAIQRRSYCALEAILDAGGPVDLGNVKSGWSNLMHAIVLKDLCMINLLISRGADPEHLASPHGWTPLMVACVNNSEVACVRLLEEGASAQLAEDMLIGVSGAGSQLDKWLELLEYAKHKFEKACWL